MFYELCLSSSSSCPYRRLCLRHSHCLRFCKGGGLGFFVLRELSSASSCLCLSYSLFRFSLRNCIMNCVCLCLRYLCLDRHLCLRHCLLYCIRTVFVNVYVFVFVKEIVLVFVFVFFYVFGIVFVIVCWSPSSSSPFVSVSLFVDVSVFVFVSVDVFVFSPSSMSLSAPSSMSSSMFRLHLLSRLRRFVCKGSKILESVKYLIESSRGEGK